MEGIYRTSTKERERYPLTELEWCALGVAVLCLLVLVAVVYVVTINPAVDAGVLAGR